MVKLQEVRSDVESKLGTFELKKALEKQGLSKQKRAAFEPESIIVVRRAGFEPA